MKTFFFFSFYLFINIIFIFKYSYHQELIPIPIIYFLFFSFILFILLILKNNSCRTLYKSSTYFIITIIFLIITILINNLVDGYLLNVDRWSALHVSIKSLLNSQYPYTSIDHLGGRSSHLPTLMILSIPFYYLGDVGYLQSFSFLILSITIFIAFDPKRRLAFLLLVICSPCYLWELYAKSDLMSNTIFILFFIVLIKRFNLINRPIFIGISFSTLILTRLYAIIPLSLMIIRCYIISDKKWKTSFSISSLITLLLLSTIVLYNAPSIEIIKEYNPIYLQIRNIPIYILILTSILAIYISLKYKDLITILEKSVLLILLPTLLYFFKTIWHSGFISSISNDIFDISYLSISMPLVIYCMIANFPIDLLPSESTPTTK